MLFLKKFCVFDFEFFFLFLKIGKRPGGRHLPTGVIKRPDPVPSVGNRPIDAKDGPGSPKGAWSRYMAEVERYRNQSCSDETPNRPLVK